MGLMYLVDFYYKQVASIEAKIYMLHGSILFVVSAEPYLISPIGAT